MDSLDNILYDIDKFNKDRDWDQFHAPANLAKSISIEAAELLECFQWNDDNYNLNKVKEELADVLIYALQMSLKLNLNPLEIIKEKIQKNAEKYPISKAKGSSKKYNEL